MDLLIVLVVVGVVIAVVVSRSQRREKRRELEALESVRSAAEEDVTRFGEDVTLLGNETAGRQLDDATRQDYRRALDAYDAAKAALGRMQRPDDVRGITGILEDGRYAVSCVQARLAGQPAPPRLPPCFFNPQHGPSSENVDWAPPGGVPRSVPACPADAERVRVGAEPDVRKVPVGAGRRPYWEAGPGYGPYAQGYFSPYAASGLLPGVLLGAVMFGGFGGWDGDGSHDGGGDAGNGGDGGGDDGGQGDGGQGDGGDFDSGGDFDGGFDGGGFDGGGFDGGF